MENVLNSIVELKVNEMTLTVKLTTKKKNKKQKNPRIHKELHYASKEIRPRTCDRTLTTKELRVAAARGSPPYGRCEVVDPEYGAKAEPEEERPSSSVLGPKRTPELKDGQECRARDTDGWKRKP